MTKPKAPKAPQMGAVVKTAREKSGLTQAEVAARAGVDSSVVERIEQGRQPNPQLQSIGPIADAIGLKLDKIWKALKDDLSDEG